MKDIHEYLLKTRSAVAKLFDAINSYKKDLTYESFPVFVTSATDPDDFEKQYKVWQEENRAEIDRSVAAQKEYFAEAFALSNLCGAVLQSAAMAIRQYSQKGPVPEDFQLVLKENSDLTAFCIGRNERDVPIGLIIYAGRNQYNHYEDKTLKKLGSSVFEKLATVKCEYVSGGQYVDPAFDLNNRLLICYAHNILALIGWDRYENYERDLIDMLDT